MTSATLDADESYVSRPIALQRGARGRSPVFLVPGGAATASSFLALVDAMEDEIPVYGLEPRGLDGVHAPHRSVSAAASSYLEAIRQVQPSGPYRFGGHSFGGWVALEMALQMQQQGERVGPLLLIDTQVPSTPSDVPKPRVDRLGALSVLIEMLEQSTGQKIQLTRTQLEHLGDDDQLNSLLAELQRIGVLPRYSKLPFVRHLFCVFEANLNTHYVPRCRFNGAALVVQALGPLADSEGSRAHERATLRAWENHIATIESARLPGTHMSVLQAPYVRDVASWIGRLWKE